MSSGRAESLDFSGLDGTGTVGNGENKSLLISQPSNPEESRNPLKQFHLAGEKVFARSTAVITLYVSETGVAAGKGECTVPDDRS
jgi:hypothetical protein